MATRGTARLPHLPDRLTGLNPVALFCRRVGNGYYFVRFRSSNGEGKTAVSRIAVRRSGGRFMKLRAFDRRPGCGRLRAFRLSRPVFGGTTRRSLGVSFRLASTGNVRVDLLRGRKVVRRLARGNRPGGKTQRLRVRATGLRRGNYRIRIRLNEAPKVTQTLTARRL